MVDSRGRHRDDYCHYCGVDRDSKYPNLIYHHEYGPICSKCLKEKEAKQVTNYLRLADEAEAYAQGLRNWNNKQTSGLNTDVPHAPAATIESLASAIRELDDLNQELHIEAEENAKEHAVMHRRIQELEQTSARLQEELERKDEALKAAKGEIKRYPPNVLTSHQTLKAIDEALSPTPEEEE